MIPIRKSLSDGDSLGTMCQNDAETKNGTANAKADTQAATSEPDPEGSWRPALVCMADIEPRSITWIWPQRIASGRITLMVGMPGAGKSFLTCDMASRISTGTPWPDDSECQRGSVVLITAEDDPHDTIRPRLDAHHADVSRIHLLSGALRTEKGKAEELTFTLADVDILRQTLERIDDCRLVVIDPIGSFLGGRCDAHRDNEVRSVLAPIAKLAEQHGAAVLMVAHRRKSVGTIADDTALGSRAFTGIARSVWHLSRDTEDHNRRLLLPGKCNLAAVQPGLGFTIAGEPASVHWERDPVTMTADDALAQESQTREQQRGPCAKALEEASTWLRSVLEAGPRLNKELLDEWKNGQGGSKRTLDRAKQSLKVEAYRDEVPGPWWWRLPVKDAKGPKEEQPGNLGNVAETAGKLADLGPMRTKDAKSLFPGNVDSNNDLGEL